MTPLTRIPEPERMDDPEEVRVYAAADFAAVNAAFVERLTQLAPNGAGTRAVDLGCGPGDMLVRVGPRRPGWKLYGVDASLPMLRVADQALASAGSGQRVMLLIGDAKRLPLAASSCDVIFSNSLLHHLPESTGFWREVRRVAAPGALLFLRDLMRPLTVDAARRIVAEQAAGEPPLLQEEFYRSLLSAFTPDEVRAQLQAEGLAHLHVEVVTDRHMDVYGIL